MQPDKVRIGTVHLVLIIILLVLAFPTLARFIGWMLSVLFSLIVVIIAVAVVSHSWISP